MNKRVAMSQLRRAIELWLCHTENEGLALEVPAIVPLYVRGRSYARGEIFAWGHNAVGDRQLYRVAEAHVSDADDPAADAERYRPLGLTGGVPVWAAPTHTDDAYEQGDRVAHRGALWVSLWGGNMEEPGGQGGSWQAV